MTSILWFNKHSLFILLVSYFIVVAQKDDESLRRWKEQLLGGVDASAVEGTTYI